MDYFKENHSLGHKWNGRGGWRCYCCGPKRRDRPVARRHCRRTLRQLDRLAFKKEA